MTEKKGHFNEDSNLKVSSKFSADIKSLYQTKHKVPPEVDMAIIDRANQHFAQKEFGKTKPRRFRLVHLWKVAAAAAVIILAFSLNLTQKSQLQRPEQEQADRSVVVADIQNNDNDIDHNGRVDILDAFTLAKQIKSEKYNEAECDINGDGMVDNKDIDAVALAAVRLDKGVL